MKPGEIYLNKSQSLMLLLSVVVIAVLSFVLGYMTRGEGEEKEIVAESTNRPVAQPYSVPVIPESQAKAELNIDPEKAASNEMKSLVKESEMTFFDSLSEDTKKRAVKKEPVVTSTAKPIPVKVKQKQKSKPTPKIVRGSSKKTNRPSILNKPPRPLNSGGKNLYTVQVSSFIKKEDAFELKNRLKRKGYDSYILTFMKNDTKWFRVRVGTVVDRQEAIAMSQKLSTEEKLDNYISKYTM